MQTIPYVFSFGKCFCKLRECNDRCGYSLDFLLKASCINFPTAQIP